MRLSALPCNIHFMQHFRIFTSPGASWCPFIELGPMSGGISLLSLSSFANTYLVLMCAARDMLPDLTAAIARDVRPLILYNCVTPSAPTSTTVQAHLMDLTII